MPLLCDMGNGLLIMLQNTKSWTDQCTLMEQRLADRGDGEELVDTKVGGVYSTDSQLQPYALTVWYGRLPADYVVNF